MADKEAAGGLGDIELLARDGRAVIVRTLWAERPIVLALIRHFG